MNIKNERVHALARRAAHVTGLSQTGAIEEALTRLLRDYDVDPDATRVTARMDVVRAIAAEYRADPPDRPREIDVIEDLYDSKGLPR